MYLVKYWRKQTQVKNNKRINVYIEICDKIKTKKNLGLKWIILIRLSSAFLNDFKNKDFEQTKYIFFYFW